MGVLSLVGSISLTMMLALPEDTAREVSRKFIGTALDAHSADMNDLVGELVNIVAGDAAARLESLDLRVRLSLPAVIRGEGLAYCPSASLFVCEQAYRGPEGPFWMTILISDTELPTPPMPGCAG